MSDRLRVHSLRVPGAAVTSIALLCTGALWVRFALADDVPIRVGVIVSQTGGGASLGIPEKNTVGLLPREIGGKRVEYLILDDASDTTTAVKDIRKLTSEDRVDVVVGSTLAANSLAMIDPAAEAQTPMISLAASVRIVDPVDAKRAWIFKAPQNDSLMASAVADDMVASRIRTVAFIGLNDSYGQNWWVEAAKQFSQRKLRVLENESYAPADSSVAGQILRILAANPDAVLIASRGTPAVLPQKTLRDLGYRGAIYQTHGVANNDFLRLGGKDVEGTFVPVGPVLVASQLPDSNPIKQTALKFVNAYEHVYGPGSANTFAAHMWDSNLMLQRAIPLALKSAQPGTLEFRKALRDSLESARELAISQGIINVSKTEHGGLDERARVMVRIEGGQWKLLPEGDARLRMPPVQSEGRTGKLIDSTIATILTQDGITNGAIYALLALALVLVFAVTRVVFIPQGEFVSYGALTLASLEAGKLPGTAWLLVGAGIATACVEVFTAVRAGQMRRIPKALALCVAAPVALLYLTRWATASSNGRPMPMVIQIALTLLLVVPLGPMIYRLAYQRLARASVLVLLIVSMGVHFVLTGLGLYFFGAEGSRTQPFSGIRINTGAAAVSGQSIVVVTASAVLILALYLFFSRTLSGKALRATAANRLGAQLVGISITASGRRTFTLAALLGAVSGILIAPITTIYYDSGFLMGLKGFVAAIVGGLVSYPLAAAGALFIGLLEAFGSFWASAYKEVIVFTLIIPVLLWRSLATRKSGAQDDEEDV